MFHVNSTIYAEYDAQFWYFCKAFQISLKLVLCRQHTGFWNRAYVWRYVCVEINLQCASVTV